MLARAMRIDEARALIVRAMLLIHRAAHKYQYNNLHIVSIAANSAPAEVRGRGGPIANERHPMTGEVISLDNHKWRLARQQLSSSSSHRLAAEVPQPRRCCGSGADGANRLPAGSKSKQNPQRTITTRQPQLEQTAQNRKLAGCWAPIYRASHCARDLY